MRRKDATGKGDYTDAFSPVPHVSDLRILLAIATDNDMFTDHVDISQAFTQGDLQPGDGYMGNLYISAPPDFLTWIIEQDEFIVFNQQQTSWVNPTRTSRFS